MLRDRAEVFKKILRVILNTEGVVLFHCTAGKDRTGVLAALLLLAAGVVILLSPSMPTPASFCARCLPSYAQACRRAPDATAPRRCSPLIPPTLRR
jgi:hypothetical protein